jgi:type IV secretory pathway TrbF-like protein
MESNPYLEACREWDEEYADLVPGKHNWQIAASSLFADLAYSLRVADRHGESLRIGRRRILGD